ncbi:MAG TPA: hypothetical protein VK525_11085 [Candidatus Saccharimonadales bacterium]|nr:hypothetical protein [Candidatus Saccharimonadales bacterium]
MPEKLLDSLHTGLVTSEELDAKPYGFRVTWIKWDSGFRGSDLQITDRIIGIDGILYDATNRKDHDQAPGGYAEDQYWEKKGARDGQSTTLTIWRDGEALQIAGLVRADRSYTNDAGRRAIAPAGPEALTNDGFDNAWMGWLEKFEDRASRIFDGGWQHTLNIRQELADALEEGPRIDFLLKKYPGPFATVTKSDYDRLIDSLRGKKYALTPADLAYRSLTQHRVDDAIAAGQQARASFLSKNSAAPLDSLPAVDPIRGDRQSVAGQVVEIASVQEIAEAGHGWYYAQGAQGAVYLIDSRSPAMTAVYLAVERFKQLVSPEVNDVHQFIGKVTTTPTMVAAGRRVYTGLVIEVLADTVDGKVFVDLTTGGAEPLFANEEKMHPPPVVNTSAKQSPEQVMTSFINALKLGDQDLWSSFFATWSCSRNDDGNCIYDLNGGPDPGSHSMDYVHARRMIMSDVYDIRVAKVGPLRSLLDKPKIEGVTIELDHIGLFDGEYHAYRNAELHRMWRLQRVDNGPWRITSDQGI